MFRKQNHRNIELHCPNEDGHTVGVLLRDGKLKYYRWCGFMSRQQAKDSRGISIKLSIYRVDDYYLSAGEYVHGCLTDQGAFALIDSSVAILNTDLTS